MYQKKRGGELSVKRKLLNKKRKVERQNRQSCDADNPIVARAWVRLRIAVCENTKEQSKVIEMRMNPSMPRGGGNQSFFHFVSLPNN